MVAYSLRDIRREQVVPMLSGGYSSGALEGPGLVWLLAFFGRQTFQSILEPWRRLTLLAYGRGGNRVSSSSRNGCIQYL